MTSVPLYLALAVAGGVVLVLSVRKRRSRLPLPPSPKWYPVIGNYLSMPRSFEYKGFLELGKQLGSDVVSLSFFGTTIIVLNSAQPATDLFDKRSAIYSDRRCFPAMGEPSLMNWSTNLSVEGYSDSFKKHRRMMHMWLNKQAVAAFYPSQQRQARQLLQRLLVNKDEVVTSEHLAKEFSRQVEHLTIFKILNYKVGFRTLAGTLLQSIYGYNLQSLDDPFLLEAREVIDHMVRAVTPSVFLVNTFPALVHIPNWFPGTQWKKTLRGWGKQKDAVLEGMFNWTKVQMSTGSSEPSMVASFVGEIDKWGRNEAEASASIQEVAIGLLGGGTDTGVGALTVFALTMLLFPEAQAKAQQEIDAVVSTDRLPTLEDQPNLPYIERLILECARWRPIIPFGIPHKCTEDNEYRGYFFPRGAVVFGNVWAMSRDESVYPNPEAFNPDRFLDPNVPPAPVFGWGRRICPGIHYSDSSLFIVIASILAAFTMTPCKDDSDNFILPTISSENASAFRPMPFKCIFTPRSDFHAELIRNGP